MPSELKHRARFDYVFFKRSGDALSFAQRS